MCCLWYYQKPLSTGKLSEPSCAEGKGFVGDVAMSVGDLLIQRGIPYVAKKKGIAAGGYYTSELMRNPELQQKAISYCVQNAQPAKQKVGSELLNQLSTAVRPNKKYKTDRPNLGVLALIHTQLLANFPRPKKVGLCINTITVVLTTLK